MITRRTVLSATGAAVAASAVGAHVASADLFFTTGSVSYGGASLPGLA